MSKTLCIVTIPKRLKNLKQIIYSCVNQVDNILLYCNYPEGQKIDFNHEKLQVFYSYEEDGDLGSNGKIWLSQKVKEGYVFFLDDDIIVFENYFNNIINKIILYDSKVIVSYHGGILPKNVKNFTKQRQRYDFEEVWYTDKSVNIIGSGVSGFLKPNIILKMEDFPLKNKDDLYLAIWANKNKIPLIVCGREKKMCQGFYEDQGLWNLENSVQNVSEENTKIAQSITWNLYTPINFNKNLRSVDIIIPIYNTNFLWLKESLDSCLNQTYDNKYINIILINDGSEKKYSENLKKMVENIPQIKLIENETNLGISKSLNKALDISTSDFVCRMDSDDIMFPTRIEKQIDSFSILSKNVAVQGTNIITSNHYKTQHPLVVTKNNLLNSPGFWVLNHPTVCFRGDIIRKLRYPETTNNLPEDIICWYHILDNNYEIVNIPDVTLFYREHSQNNSKKLLKINKDAIINYNKSFEIKMYDKIYYIDEIENVDILDIDINYLITKDLQTRVKEYKLLQSHYNIVKKSKSENYNRILILDKKDKNILDKLENINNLSFGLLYLSNNFSNYSKMTKTPLTNSYIVDSSIYDFILKNLIKWVGTLDSFYSNVVQEQFPCYHLK